MITLLLLSSLWIFSLAGYGGMVLRALPATLSGSSDENFAVRVVLGHIPVLAMGFALHLIAPLSGWYVGIIPILGIALFVRRAEPPVPRWWILALASAICLFASRPIAHGDSGYYSIPVISWIVEEPVVRGLANLDPTYGYNSSWWILSSLMAWPLGTGIGVIAVSVPFLVCVGGILFPATMRAVRGQGRWADWFLVPAFYLWLRQIVGVNTPSPSSDIPANLCTVLAFWAMIRAIKNRGSSRVETAGRYQKNIFPLAISDDGLLFMAFAVLAASAKLSAGLLLVVAAAWLGFSLLTDRGAVKALWKTRTFLFLIGCLLILQMAHGFLLSGYPLFPSGIGGWVDVPWRVDPDLPAATVARAREWAQTFGATAEQVAAVPKWKLWIGRQGSATNLAMAGLAALAGVAGTCLTALRRGKSAAGSAILLVPASTAGILLAWNLVNAPALRFGAGYAFAVLGCLAAFVGPLLPAKVSKAAVILWTLACVLSMSRLATERTVSLLYPPDLPTSTFQAWKTNQGETIFIPDGGLAWIGPRPSAPPFEFNARLQILRYPRSNRISELRRGHP